MTAINNEQRLFSNRLKRTGSIIKDVKRNYEVAEYPVCIHAVTMIHGLTDRFSERYSLFSISRFRIYSNKKTAFIV